MKKSALLCIVLLLAACSSQPNLEKEAVAAPVIHTEKTSENTLDASTQISSNIEDPENIFLQRHILIDPGHGGRDAGAVKWGVEERTLNGKIAFYLGEILREAGYKISFTRSPLDDGAGLSLAGRVNFINHINPDLIISIHHNSNPSDKPRGFSLFWSSYRPWMDESDVTVQRGGRNFPWVREEIRDNVTYVYYRNGNKIEETTGDNAYKIFDSSPVAPASESLQLASSIYREMLLLNHIEAQYFGGKDEAIVDMENRILRLNRVPAVLIECGFMSNREELDILIQDDNQRMTAKAIARGILAYIARSEID